MDPSNKIYPEQMPIESRHPLHQSDIIPGTIKQRHITEGWIVFHGVAADRPNGSTQTKVYFATDTGVLSIWDGTTWKTTTLI